MVNKKSHRWMAAAAASAGLVCGAAVGLISMGYVVDENNLDITPVALWVALLIGGLGLLISLPAWLATRR